MTIEELEHKHLVEYYKNNSSSMKEGHSKVSIEFAISVLNDILQQEFDICDKYKFGTGVDNIKISIHDINKKIQELRIYLNGTTK